MPRAFPYTIQSYSPTNPAANFASPATCLTLTSQQYSSNHMPHHFSKYHALGNDFIVVESTNPFPPSVARQLCDRHRGVGADGILFVSPSPDRDVDARMIVQNADGSRPEMCGNGLRCVAFFLARRHNPPSTTHTLNVSTDAGPKHCHVQLEPRTPHAIVTIQAGIVTTPAPVLLPVDDLTIPLFTTSIGNPHAVLIDPNVDFHTIAPLIASHRAFPAGVNVSFVRTTTRPLEVRVWERGVGPTLACGTAACAVAAVAIHIHLAPPDQPLPINLPGGHLSVSLDPQHSATLTGPAHHVFDGTLATTS